ncbi:gastrin/cholecystokinin type B receptor, partial [Ceratitis capitata]
MRSSPYAYHLGNDASEDDGDSDALDYQMAAAISSNHRQHPHHQMELKLKEIPEKYLMVIAHFLAGDFNDTDAMDSVNGPILKASIKSVYWLFLIQYAMLALAGIAMNVSIIAYAMYHRLYKDVTHAFIVNLALCHLVQCALVLPITLMVMLIQNWIYGQFLCFFLPMLQDIPLHVAIISHILIAWDRMRWLSDPLQGRLPAFVCCCATWLGGMVIALPYPIYTIYVELGDYVTELKGIGLCVVNLMDDMHEYMRGLFLLMYCAPSILLAYLYIRTSQELRPPDGPFAVMMFEHRADMRNRQRNSSASSVGGSVGATITSTSGIGSALTTHTNGASGGAGSGLGLGGHTSSTCSATTKTRSYDLYSAELDVYRE